MDGIYRPEGEGLSLPENAHALSCPEELALSAARGDTLEGMAVLCDADMNLTVDLGCMRGIIARDEAAYMPPGETLKDIAVISRVGRAVCFKIIGFSPEGYARLSRRLAQKEYIETGLRALCPGDIITARVTHLEPFGAFVDIGCGVVSLLPIDAISVSRIAHPSDRFEVGDRLRVVVKDVDLLSGRVYVTHKELLGTWEQNAARFGVGQTVTGIVRSVEEYGIFVELAPNLAGLAEYKEGVLPGAAVAVYIKNIIPDRMKIKLVLLGRAAPHRERGASAYYTSGLYSRQAGTGRLTGYDAGNASAECGYSYSSGRTAPGCVGSRGYDSEPQIYAMEYFIPDDVSHIDSWRYSPESCQKAVVSIF